MMLVAFLKTYQMEGVDVMGVQVNFDQMIVKCDSKRVYLTTLI